MGLAAAPVTSGYAVPLSGLAQRKFVCHNFDAYRRNNKFVIIPYLWVAADLYDLTGTSLTATTYPVGNNAVNPTEVELIRSSDGKLTEWFKLSQGGATSDAYNIKEDWEVPPNVFSFDSSPTTGEPSIRGVNVTPPGIRPALWRRMLKRFAL